MHNFKIFPGWITSDKRKVPLFGDWREKATNDQNQIQQWNQFYKERIHHWAIPTGTSNGILVLDIDVKHDGFGKLQKLGLQVPDTLFQDTISGGRHYFFKYPSDGKHYGQRVGMFEKESGIDVRGEGGYVFFYGKNFNPHQSLAEAPTWLIQEMSVNSPAPQGDIVKIAPEIATGIFQSSIEAIRQAPPGESNNVLNTESFKVGQLVASGSLTREYAEAELFKAAKARGKPDYEAKATIKSGLDGGGSKPLTSPFGKELPKLAFNLPPIPEQTRWTPPHMTRADLLNTSKLRKPQLFKDWSTRDITLTTADGGTGKTTLKLFEAVCLALGHDFLGFPCKQKGRTLFITGEDTKEKLAAMLGVILKQMGLLEPSPENDAAVAEVLASVIIKKDSDMCFIAKDRQGFLIPSADAANKLMQAIDDFDPDMIVIDPLASFWGSESALNDMAKAIAKLMGNLLEYRGDRCIDMINHMGKQSSANKDATQFAGRGGTGLPSHARVCRVLRPLRDDEYTDMTGESLGTDQSAMQCTVNKFTDGSPLYHKPFIILRTGFLFSRKDMKPEKAKEAEKSLGDVERIFTFVKEARGKNKYPTREVIVGHFMLQGDPISEQRCKRAIGLLSYEGYLGERIKTVENPDASSKDKVFVIADMDGKETN